LLAHACESVLPGGIAETEIRSRRIDLASTRVFSQLIPAPSRRLLDTFGGMLSISQFRGQTSYFNLFPPGYLLPDTKLTTFFTTQNSHYEEQIFGVKKPAAEKESAPAAPSADFFHSVLKSPAMLAGRMKVRRKPEFAKAAVCQNLPFHRKK
jgi:hypothetical protein